MNNSKAWPFLFLVITTLLASQGTVAHAKTQDDPITQQIMADLQEYCITYLRPGQITQRLAEVPVVYVPIGPVEWHGLHMPFGTDPLVAEAVALGVCKKVGGMVWPTLHWGSASLRSPEESMRLFGPQLNQYTWSVEFPCNTLKSAYCSEEVLALLIRETIRQIALMNPKLIVILSGHAAGAHIKTLERVALEESVQAQGLKVVCRGAWILEPKDPEKFGGHACAGETSQMMYLTSAVDLGTLPPLPQKLEYYKTGIVDDWSGANTNGYVVNDIADPRINSSVEYGELNTHLAIDEIAGEVQKMIPGLH